MELPKELDLIVGGTPCQDFSNNGRGQGGDENSGTRSSLMWHYLKLIEITRPKVIVWENVTAMLHKKHIHNFRKFVTALSGLEYTVYADVLNAKDFNLPQNRARVFVVAVFKRFNIPFEFPQGYDSGIRIKDVLQEDFPPQVIAKHLERIEVYRRYQDADTHKILYYGHLHWNNFKQNNIVTKIDGISYCLQASNDTQTGAKIYDDRPSLTSPVIRCLTALESFRMMGFSDEDFTACLKAGVKQTQLYKQAGNSIAVGVLAAIFGQLYSLPWEDVVFGKRKKAQEQIYGSMPLLSNLSEPLFIHK